MTAMLLASCAPDPVPQRPNVLFVSIDDLRPALGVYGDSLAVTPHLDAFALTGTTFRNAFCQSAVCAPSRASLMTGLRPDSTRVWHLGDKFRELHPNIITLPQHFHSHGYYTVNIGKIFHNYMPDSVSWDEPDLRPQQYLRPEWLGRDGETFYVNPDTQRRQKERRDSLMAIRPIRYADGWNIGPAWEAEDIHDSLYYDGAQTELALRTLDRLAKKEQPFFFGFGFFRPHLPFAVPKKYWDLYDPTAIVPASNPYLPHNMPLMAMNSMYELRGYDGFRNMRTPHHHPMDPKVAHKLKHGYYASVSYVDALFGRMVQHLKDLDIYDNTIIIVWGDHGWKLGEHNSWCKQTNYDIDIHVPLLVYDPRQDKRGQHTFALTELVDIFPSLCEMAGIPAPDYLQGDSFVPLMTKPDRAWKQAAFSQFHRRPRISPDGKRYMGYSVRTHTHHYIAWHEWDHQNGIKGNFVTDELYDIVNDPEENYNIAGLEDGMSKKMSRLLAKGWKAEVRR